ncbi:MAG: zinc-binding alcohol dehydrogenase family protein [Ruminococcaceae bacterium]|jgi:threonine dehydrogenase-like Zn-dependent dehydrogenase|nr:zinc-binding alcohol dehydrogenase family protein [Oscillospiraceae bacterium]
MKAVRIAEPGKMELAELPVPVPGPGEALLKIRVCGICGADVASYTGNQPFTSYPRIPGHEFSAEIVSLPDGYDGSLRPGDVVTANPYFNCGSCYACRRGHVNCCHDNRTMGVQRDGSFCEYVAMPVERIYDGRGLSAEQLALAEPFSIGWHALSRCAVKPGDKVLIAGAGPIGLFALISAKRLGAEVYSADLLDGRLDKALAFGADGVVNTSRESFADYAARMTDGGFDVTVEACGAPETFLGCIDACAFAGNIVLIGNGKRNTTFLHSILLKKELNVFGSRNSLPADFRTLIGLMADGSVDPTPMISAVYPAERCQEAFDALVRNDGSLAKVLVKFSD